MNLKQFNWSSEEYDGLFEKEVPSQLLRNPLIKKDVWRTQEDLNLEIHEHHKVLVVTFKGIYQPWFSLLSRLYILKRANMKISADTLVHELGHFKRFSKFMKEHYIDSYKNLSNEIFEQFDNWLRSRKAKLSERTISLHYTTLNNFFTICRIENWAEVNTYWFKNKASKHTKPKNDAIEYIPEEVWNQVEENLYHLPEQMQRKILIIRTLGLRVGELLNLPLNCLRKRNEQWRLRLKETEKFKIEDELPIPQDLVPVIKEQQLYIKDLFRSRYNKLFCGNSSKARLLKFTPVPKVMSGQSFNLWLNKYAVEYSICTKDGVLWHFKSHQFRKTVGTIFTNAGIRGLIIQKYLRHRNPDMQNYYKHLLKEVIGNEYEALIKEKNFVNIEGKVVATHQPQDAIEEYMRLRMHQITTQQGECHRSNLKKPCPTVNGCWRCGDWMTSESDLPFLKQDFKRLNLELEKAKKLEMLRTANEIQKDIDYLLVRIEALEKIINYD